MEQIITLRCDNCYNGEYLKRNFYPYPRTFYFIAFFFFKRERRARGRDKHQWVRATSICNLSYMSVLRIVHAWARDWTHNPGMCPDWESNPQPFGCGQYSHQLSHPSQGWTSHLYLLPTSLHCCVWLSKIPTHSNLPWQLNIGNYGPLLLGGYLDRWKSDKSFMALLINLISKWSEQLALGCGLPGSPTY